MSPEEATKRRRVVYHALRQFVPDAAAREALELLDEAPFSNGSVLVASEFVRVASRRIAGIENEPRLFFAMAKLMGKRAEDIGPDPLFASPAPAASQVAAAAAVSAAAVAVERSSPEPQPVPEPSADPAHRVFNAVMTALAERVDASRAAAAVVAGLAYSPLSAWAQNSLRRWAEDPTRRPLTDGFSPQEMSWAVHELYVWSCNELGPALADRALGQALRQAEALPEAFRFSPRNLL